MDLTKLTDDELASHIGAGIREAERRADALPKGDERRAIRQELRRLHNVAEKARSVVSGHGMIQPLSGGDPKPPGGP
jgi:hypothetical protein